MYNLEHEWLDYDRFLFQLTYSWMITYYMYYHVPYVYGDMYFTNAHTFKLLYNIIQSGKYLRLQCSRSQPILIHIK